MNKIPTLIPELKVFDFDQSLNFYTRLAKFEVIYERVEESFAMLAVNGAYLMIEGLNGATTRSWLVGPMERPFGRGINLQIEVPDVHLLHQGFVNAKYPIFFDLEEKWYRADNQEIGHKQFLVQDPDGYLLRFCEKIGVRPL
ncbi:MAG: bleomycin resistance protein [Parachlamydiaceae bacterium]